MEAAVMAQEQENDGAVLAIIMVLLAVFVGLGMGLMRLSSADTIEASKSVSGVQAFWNAEAGLEIAKAMAQKERKPFNVMGIYGSGVITGSTCNGSYSCDIEDDPDWVNVGNLIKRYLISSTGSSRSDVTRTVTIRAAIETFASYMHASGDEETPGGQNIYFGPNDVIDGAVYVNDEINIYGTARILGLTRTAASSVNYAGGGTSNTFEGGIEFGVDELDFSGAPGEDHVESIKDDAIDEGLVLLNKDYIITFLEDGKFSFEPTDGSIDALTNWVVNNSAIYVEEDVHVQGVVNGKVSIASDESIYIDDDIVYAGARNPTPFEPFFFTNIVTDSLGLVARDEVQITGTDTINIHASILVTDGDDGFNADFWNSDIGTPSINLYGSISQVRRGVVGRANGDGFSKNYKYDTRFIDEPPPHYPYSAYTIAQWEQ